MYDEPGGYNARRPYLAIFKVTHLTDTTAYIHSAVGKIDRETRTKALNLLREKGIKTVMLERHGRIKTVEL